MTRNSTYHSVRILGGLLPSDLLERVGAQDSDLESSLPVDYDLAPGERLGEAITRSWNRLRPLWERFTERSDQTGALTGPTRQEWLLPLFQELGFGHLSTAPGFEFEGKGYPISHLWESTPIHLVGVGVELDRRTPGVAGAASVSPHGLMQEFLNRSDGHLWGIISNGYQLRLLRDNASLTRTAYVEFDLREMFEGDAYSDFALLWLTCNASRLEGSAGKEVLERWREDAATRGIRALDALRNGVEAAIETLGSAAVGHPDNVALRTQLDDGTLDAQDLYRQILRVVYRFLFLFVAEGRDLLLDPDAEPAARGRYERYYSMTRLRDLAATTRGGLHGDLWRQHTVVARALEATGEPALGLLPLGGLLWSSEATAALNDVTIPNEALLSAARSLTMVKPPGELLQRVDYANLGAEELGSIYEALLEYTPEVNLTAGTFELSDAAGNERKTSGSYYTPTSLINELLDSALDPVVDDAARSPEPEQAILDLKVLDPAAGSGHFLIAAANRIADRLARVRAGDDEPSPEQLRTSLRDVIGRCIYAVDINPMAVELARVALWIEAMEPGKPLTFLDHHIVCGNSLLGSSPKLIEQGIPDKAYTALVGDDSDHVRALKARNRRERDRGLIALSFDDQPADLLQHVADELSAIDRLDGSTIDGVVEKRERFKHLKHSREQRRLRLAADMWVAAFVGPKSKDSPDVTTAVVNAALNDPDSVTAELESRVVALADKFRFHHWHLSFPDVFTRNGQDDTSAGWPGGFDAVLGNPPWEHTEIKEKEWFAQRAPAIAAAPTGAIRKQMIEKLATTDPVMHAAFQDARRQADAISLFARVSGRYPLCGTGRINTYALFSELSAQVISHGGFAGIIVPTGIATDHTTKAYFRFLVSEGRLRSLLDFENRSGFFPHVHSSARFVLLTLGPETNDEALYGFFLQDVSDLSDPGRTFSLSAEDVALVNPNTHTAPVFRTSRDAALAQKVYRALPVFMGIERSTRPWDASLVREFNMTSESHKFATADKLRGESATRVRNAFVKEAHTWLPLYEAKMMDLHDHRAADVVLSATAVVRQGQPQAILDEEHKDPWRWAMPRYWVHENDIAAKLDGRVEPYLLTFREVTAPTNWRTMVPAIIPWSAVGYKLWIVLPAHREDSLALSAMFGSFVFDYFSRQKVGGTTMAAFVVEQLPVVPRDTMYEPCPWSMATTTIDWIALRIAELSATAWDLVDVAEEGAGVSSPFTWSVQRRPFLLAELDAAFFHLYGITREDADYIMGTFPIVKRKDVAEHGSYRTKELIIDIYDRIAKAIEAGEPYQTVLDPPPADSSLCQPPREGG